MSARHREPSEGLRDRSLLRAHWIWILVVALVATGGALVLTRALHHPLYQSEVRVVVEPEVTPSGAALTTNMETERQVAISGVITTDAARATGTTAEALQRGLSVRVPAETTVLVIDYQDRTAEAAQQRAQAVADAYIAYRSDRAAVLSAASTPEAASSPPYLVNGVAGLALGLALGLGSALLRDRRDDRLRGPVDLADQTGLPMLATIPVRHGRRGTGRPVPGSGSGTPSGEAYRHLRVKLRRMARGHGRTPAVTLFTSAATADVAATVAAGTAAALATGGSRVLLVEADQRTPRSGSPDGPPDVGLEDVLAGRVPLREALSEELGERLMRLSAGSEPAHAVGEMLDERSLGWLLGQVPADVDHVVLHGPPVLTAAETSTMAEHADLVVLVAALGSTHRRDVAAAVSELRGTGAVLAGTVLVVRSRRADGPRQPARRPGGGAPVRPEEDADAADQRDVGTGTRSMPGVDPQAQPREERAEELP